MPPDYNQAYEDDNNDLPSSRTDYSRAFQFGRLPVAMAIGSKSWTAYSFTLEASL
jgi:hypothetical protein